MDHMPDVRGGKTRDAFETGFTRVIEGPERL